MSNLTELRIVDNFYQTSAFLPMPTIAISTTNPDGTTNVGAYSLCTPYYIAGDTYAMLLICRNNSNTCQNLLRNHKCALNYIKDDPETFKELVRLGYPGPSEEKMADCRFAFEKSTLSEDRPDIISDSYQVFECTWLAHLEDAERFQPGETDGYTGPFNHFNGITSPMGAHFILQIDRILMEDIYRDAIINGVTRKSFPPVPVDYGYRDSTSFWYTRFPAWGNHAPRCESVAAPKNVDMMGIRYAANRADDTVKFAEDALPYFAKVPRPFLKSAMKGCVSWAKENDVTLITGKHMEIINDKRAKEKGLK